MKKIVLMFAAASLMLATPSCKKGENDPFLTFSSRKARVAGEWTVSGYDFSSLSTYSNGDTDKSTEVLNGNVVNITDTYTSGGTSTTTTGTQTIDDWSFTFEKDGTWTGTKNTTTVEEEKDYPFTDWTTTTTTVETASYSGNWSFVGKVKDEYKNKERMIMNYTSYTGSDQTTVVIKDDTNTSNTNVGDKDQYTYNYYSGEVAQTWEIDQLKGKEMIVKVLEEESGTSSTTPDGGSTTTSTHPVYSSTTTITLTAK